MIMQLLQPDGKWAENDAVCKAAAMSGDVSVLQWMSSHAFLTDDMLCTEAARHGQVSML